MAVAHNPYDHDYGRRLLPHVIDARAAEGHHRPYALIPHSSNPQDGFRSVEYSTFANAINRTSHWLTKTFQPRRDLEAIAYIGPNDLRYHIISMAAIKSGFTMFFPSPRNTPQILDQLLDSADIEKLVIADQFSPLFTQLMTIRTMDFAVIASCQDLLSDTQVAKITVNATFEAWRYRPWIFLHTSGSTGLPKIVPIKHGYISASDAYRLVEESTLLPRYGDMNVFVPFPPFHVAGITFSLPMMCWVDGTVVLPPPNTPLTPELVSSIHKHAKVEHSVLPPSIIADLSKSSDYLATLGQLKGLTFSGGPLSSDIATIIASRTQLYSTMGATEYGGIPTNRFKDVEDYNFFRFNDELAGLEFRRAEGVDELYELVFVRKKNALSNLVQAIFVTFPDLQEYRTKDVFSKHPTKPGLWKYEARIDDILVLSNGEKINPLTMESVISACPEVKACLIIGQARFQTALLVEMLASTPETLPKGGSSVENYIQKANQLCPKYARLSPAMVYRLPPGRMLLRSPKGTILRQANAAHFESVIEALYADHDQTNPPSNVTQFDFQVSSRHDLEIELSRIFANELDVSNVGVDENLFALGLDSLMVVNLVRTMGRLLESSSKSITPKLIYDNPTIAGLAAKLTLLKPASTPAAFGNKEDDGYDSSDSDADRETWNEMEDAFNTLRAGPVTRRKKHRIRNLLYPEEVGPIYPPDTGRRAWRQVMASFLINLNNWGLVTSFSVFQAYYETVLLRDISASNIAWIGTVQGALLLLVGVFSGPLFDLGYFKLLLIMANTGIVAGMMLLSLATSYYQVFLSQSILIGICMGLLYIPSVALIPQYFDHRRGLALGLALSGGSIGGVLYPVMFSVLLERIGFSWVCRVFGFLALVSLALATVLLEPIAPQSIGIRDLFDRGALREAPFLTLMASSFVAFCGLLVPVFLSSSFAITVTLDPTLSFYCTAILSAAQFFGRTLPAALSDFSQYKCVPGPEIMLLSAQIAAGILSFCWIAVSTTPTTIVWLIFYGFFSGIVVTLAAIVTPYVCPNLAVFGTRLGMLYSVAGLGVLIGTPVGLSLNEASGGFFGSQVWSGVCCLLGASFFAYTAYYARRQRQLLHRKVRRNPWRRRRTALRAATHAA